jgi:pimeloyl-ACP methyl ester carboxylesterase
VSGRPWPVILLPGGVLPAGPAYGPLLAELGSGVDAHPKDLEVYAEDAPPPGFSLATEVAGITRVADDAGFERFHLVGYSGGGASSLAFAAEHPDRLLSLALMEPAFAGWQEMTQGERAHLERFRPLLEMHGPDMFATFQGLQVAPGVELPAQPPGPPPSWMAKRPAGLHAFLRTFLTSDLDLDSLRRFDRPVWFALGGRSHPDYFARMAERLARVFPDFTVERFPDRHHFDPPHRIEPARVAGSLRRLWARAELAAEPGPAPAR